MNLVFKAEALPPVPDVQVLYDRIAAAIEAQRQPWRLQAACAGVPVDRFFPERKDAGGDSAAKQYCASCPVTAECLDAAVAEGDWLKGVWGGTSHRGRRSLRETAA